MPPNPTELRLHLRADHHRIEEYRNVHCRYYARCIDTAVKHDWDGFTCRECSLFTVDVAPRAERLAFNQPADNGRP